MKEAERLRRIELFEKRKKELEVLEKREQELRELRKNTFVQKYLKLAAELSDELGPDLEEAERDAFSIYSGECDHDLYFYMGGRCDVWEWDDFRTYIVTDPDKIEYYLYRCLDCCSSIEVLKKDNEEFLRTHRVIQLPRYANDSDFHEVRELYHEFLFTNSVDNTYQKLLKKVR